MDCLKCKSALRSVMARPRPKALLEALEKVGGWVDYIIRRPTASKREARCD